MRVYHGDCLRVLRLLEDASFDAVVTDPPYDLAFMGKKWDGTGIAFQVDVWAECWRVLKPGGFLLAFGGTRTYHRLVCAVEDAGFEIRDSITWLYGSGFPKSLDVSKAIDKAAGAERTEVIGQRSWSNAKMDAGQGISGLRQAGGFAGEYEAARVQVPITAPATPDAVRWAGWGTALKPASEPIVVARKPLVGTVAANVLAHGTGALNIDGCRVAGRERIEYGLALSTRSHGATYGAPSPSADFDSTKGRWPSNVVLSHVDDCADACVPGCAVAELDGQSGKLTSGQVAGSSRHTVGGNGVTHGSMAGVIGSSYADSGGASRFFPAFRYQAKAPTRERPKVDGVAHPTVKPLALMQWLVRLVTPPGGAVLDPFAGSGTTAEAAAAEGLRCSLIESDDSYLPLINARLRRAGVKARTFTLRRRVKGA